MELPRSRPATINPSNVPDITLVPRKTPIRNGSAHVYAIGHFIVLREALVEML